PFFTIEDLHAGRSDQQQGRIDPGLVHVLESELAQAGEALREVRDIDRDIARLSYGGEAGLVVCCREQAGGRSTELGDREALLGRNAADRLACLRPGRLG